MTGLSAALLAHAITTYDAVRILPQGVFWIEGRPDGRDVLVRWTPSEGTRDVTPAGFGVESRVHEYGGGAWTIANDTVWCCDAGSQRIYQVSDGASVPITPEPPEPGSMRYADLTPDPSGRYLWAVRERHEPAGVINELVQVPITQPSESRIVASGWDFYSFPRPSPDRCKLAWTCWNAPQMPWDGTHLFVADVDGDAGLGEHVLVAGGPEESVFQPAWSPSGVLHFVSDRNGWWNLYSWKNGETVPVLEDEAELGVAQWEFGYSTYAFLDADRIAVIVQRGTRQTLEVVTHGTRRRIDLPYTSIKPYLSAWGSEIALIASSPAETPSVVIVDADRGTTRKIAGSNLITGRNAPVPEPFTFPTRDGAQAHGLYYGPWDSPGGPPPLVVKAHPGPTANVPMRLDWHTQYLASHGFAVAEIDYRGSTGYGRAYRNALRGRWGESDALDCADSAAYLAGAGKADPDTTTIWGASAGGYSALRALQLTKTFTAGIAQSPVINPLTWRETAPKFQAHHTDSLVGPWPASKHTYRERSVVDNAGGISAPVLILHGEQDPITPARESCALDTVLGKRSKLVLFPRHGHSLHTTEAQRYILELELKFLGSLLAPQ